MMGHRMLLSSLVAMVVVLSLQPARVLACQCARHSHPQQYMCEADYVIRGKVVSETYIPHGDVKSSKAPLPTIPPTTTKRPPFKLPTFREPQWWEPVIRPPHPREGQPPEERPQWRNPFVGFHDRNGPPPLVLADQPQLPHIPEAPMVPAARAHANPADTPLITDPDTPLMVADQPPQPRHQPPPQRPMAVPEPLGPQFGYKDAFPWQYRRRYTVKVDKVYKGEERIAARSTIYVFTESDGGMCGKELKLDTRYLIAGYFVEGEIFIDLCDWVIEKSKLTKDQRKGLRHTYKKYCDTCRIKSGTLYWPPEAKEKDVCPYNPYLMANTDCEGRYSACVRLPDGTCNWMETKGLKHCRRKTQGTFL